MWYASVSPNIWIIDDGTLDTVVRFYDGKDTQTHRYDTEYRQSFPDDDQFLRAVHEELTAPRKINCKSLAEVKIVVDAANRSEEVGESPPGNPWD